MEPTSACPGHDYGWPIRKKAIATVLAGTKPDILCVQEALEEQGKYLAELLPGHRRVGVGRDDGRTAGEHCSILFDRSRFEELGGGTFWLEEPIDRPPAEFRLGPKRICTWVRLRDRRIRSCISSLQHAPVPDRAGTSAGGRADPRENRSRRSVGRRR